MSAQSFESILQQTLKEKKGNNYVAKLAMLESIIQSSNENMKTNKPAAPMLGMHPPSSRAAIAATSLYLAGTRATAQQSRSINSAMDRNVRPPTQSQVTGLELEEEEEEEDDAEEEDDEEDGDEDGAMQIDSV